MTALLLLLVALPGIPGTIRVEVSGGEAEVVALRAGVTWARATTRNGRVLLEGLARGSYDLLARGDSTASALVRGVRTVHDRAAGVDAVLVLERVVPVDVRTSPGAVVWSRGVAFDPGALRLPIGLHRVVVVHERRVASAARLLRVTRKTSLDEPLEPGLVVLGRVVADGEPVAGARVEAFADGLTTGRWALTDSSGSFGLSGFFGAVISVRAVAPGYAARLARVDFFAGSERARTELTLAAGSRVALKADGIVEAVLLPAWYEEVLEEPRLRANHTPARRRGKRVMFTGLTPGRRYRILLSAPGRLPESTETFAAPAAGRTMALPPVSLARAASVHGAVRDAGAGLVVVCRGPGGVTTSRTDRAGRYQLDGLEEGQHLVWVRHRDERSRPLTLAAGEQATLDLTLPDPDEKRLLGGIVMDADGKPLGGVLVEAAGKSAESDEHGRFSIAGLPPGRELYTVALSPGRKSRAFLDDPHLPHREERVRVGARLRLPLRRSATLRVRFLTDGVPLSRATLHLSSRGVTLRRRLPRRAAGIEIPELAVGSYDVDVSAAGLLGTGGKVVAVRRGAAPTALSLARGRSVSGRLTLRRIVPRRGNTPQVTDRPVTRGWISLMDADPRRAMATVPVEEDGSFLLEGLPVATVVLCGGAPGFPTTALEVDLVVGDKAGLVIPLRHPVAATVIVTGDGERPLTRAHIRIQDMLRPDFGVDVRDLAALGRFRRVVAGEADFAEIRRSFVILRTPDGRFTAPFVRPGSYSFTVSAEGYKSVRVGVRARTAWQEEQIRKNLENVEGVPDDLTTRIRLGRKPAGAAKED